MSFKLVISELAYLRQDRGEGTREECIRAVLKDMQGGNVSKEDMAEVIKIIQEMDDWEIRRITRQDKEKEGPE